MHQVIADEGEMFRVAPAVHGKAAAVAAELRDRADRAVADIEDLQMGIADALIAFERLTQESNALAVRGHMRRGVDAEIVGELLGGRSIRAHPPDLGCPRARGV